MVSTTLDSRILPSRVTKGRASAFAVVPTRRRSFCKSRTDRPNPPLAGRSAKGDNCSWPPLRPEAPGRRLRRNSPTGRPPYCERGPTKRCRQRRLDRCLSRRLAGRPRDPASPARGRRRSQPGERRRQRGDPTVCCAGRTPLEIAEGWASTDVEAELRRRAGAEEGRSSALHVRRGQAMPTRSFSRSVRSAPPGPNTSIKRAIERLLSCVADNWRREAARPAASSSEQRDWSIADAISRLVEAANTAQSDPS